MRERVAAEHRALPAMIAIAVVTSDNAEAREEDYAATMMGIENLALAAVELGLGAAIRTGAVMADPAARAAAGVAENERIVAIVNVGEPAEIPGGPRKTPAAQYTHLAFLNGQKESTGSESDVGSDKGTTNGSTPRMTLTPFRTVLRTQSTVSAAGRRARRSGDG